jgi:hypothetical protein
MNEFIDAIELFAGIVKSLIQNQVNLHSPLEEMVLKHAALTLPMLIIAETPKKNSVLNSGRA